jgi:hypothetical protein
MRSLLLQELGRSFEVTATGRFLVAHPAGQRSLWPSRFEDLYRSFQHYFTARSMNLRAPEFPLVAIVMKNSADLHRYAREEGLSLSPNVLGYYSHTTNRVVLYDQTSEGADWSENADTIIHEATHQAAFNTGVHSRFAQTPKWVAEGLATMFEAPGVWNCLRHTRQADRINRGRLASFRRYASRRRAGALAEIVASDRMFQSDTEGAYAESWALTFYLAETQSAAWTRYLAKTAAYEPFQEATAQKRLADFRAAFGDHLGLVEARMLRFIEALP